MKLDMGRLLLGPALWLLGTATIPAVPRDDAPALPPIVFVSRNPVPGEDGRPEPGAIPGIGPRDRTAAVGGRMLVREPDGRLRVLIDRRRLFDVADPCVSWDGTRILFSGLARRDSSWRIYEIRANGAGFRQVTRSDRAISLAQFGAAAPRFERYDDIDPCWLPDGRICFASTRYPMIAESGDRLVTNLFVAGEDGARPHRISSERNGGEEPTIDPVTGRIVFSRWFLNLDRPSDVTRNGITFLDREALTRDVGDFWQVMELLPDGRGSKLHAGDPRSSDGMRGYKPSLLPDGRVLALYTANPSLVPAPSATGVRLFPSGPGGGRDVLGFAPEAAGGASDPESTLARPRVADPVALPDGGLLLSWAPGGSGDFGLYRCALDGSGLERVLDLPGTDELDAAVLLPSRRPPVIPDDAPPITRGLPPTENPSTFDANGTFRFDCLNVYMNAPVDAPIPDAPSIVKDARVRFFLNFQRQHPEGRDPSIFFREAALNPHGAVYENGIPGDIPLYDQLVDGKGRVLRMPGGALAHLRGFGAARGNNWAQCVGCHAGHSTMTIPNNYNSAEWFNCSTSASVQASSAWRPDGARESPCPGARVVDRRARNDSLGVAWVAAGRQGESVTLRWPIPVEASKFVIYGIRPNPRNGTDLSVERCRVTLYRDGAVVGRVADTGRIEPDGTLVAVPITRIDAAKFELLRVVGRVDGQPLCGLAEVETIARLPLE
jgi:hypothetical protein